MKTMDIITPAILKAVKKKTKKGMPKEKALEEVNKLVCEAMEKTFQTTRNVEQVEAAIIDALQLDIL